MLRSAGTVLLVSFRMSLCDIATDAWQKRPKHLDGRGAFDLWTASWVMEFMFVRYRKEADYQ